MGIGEKKEPNSGLWGKVELEGIPLPTPAPEEGAAPRMITRKGTLMGFAAPVVADGSNPVGSAGNTAPSSGGSPLSDPAGNGVTSTLPPARPSLSPNSGAPGPARPKSDSPLSPGRTLIGGSFVGGSNGIAPTAPSFPAVGSKGTLLGVPAPVLESNTSRSSIAPGGHSGGDVTVQRIVGVSSNPPPPAPAPGGGPATGHLGRFRIKRRIGTGRSGAVFLAERVDTTGGQQFLAIKVLREQVYQDQAALKALFREARIAAMMDHRNIVRVVDIGYHKRQPYLVMDFVDGLSLAALLSHPVAVPLAVGLRCISDALQGLDYAHKLSDAAGNHLGLVHCDISPENILVGVDGVSRLTDFGVARTREEHGDEFVVRARPEFAAPELLAGEQNVSPQTDVYGVGAVLFRIATGTLLFAAKTEEERMTKALTEEPATLRSLNPKLPAWLDEICARALSRDPSRRFASCLEMAQALEREAEREELLADRAAVGNWVSRVRRSLSGQEVFEVRDLGAIAEAAKRRARPEQVAATQLNAAAPVLPPEPESSSLPARLGLGVAFLLLALVGGAWAILAPSSFQAFLTQKKGVQYLARSNAPEATSAAPDVANTGGVVGAQATPAPANLPAVQVVQGGQVGALSSLAASAPLASAQLAPLPASSLDVRRDPSGGPLAPVVQKSQAGATPQVTDPSHLDRNGVAVPAPKPILQKPRPIGVPAGSALVNSKPAEPSSPAVRPVQKASASPVNAAPERLPSLPDELPSTRE